MSSEPTADTADPDTFNFAETLGMQLEDDVPDGADSCVRLQAGEEHLNIGGVVHGGVVASLIDTAMGRAVRSFTDGKAATSQLTVTYLEPAKPGLITTTAKVRKRGSSITIVEAEVEQDGSALAHGLATFVLLKK